MADFNGCSAKHSNYSCKYLVEVVLMIPHITTLQLDNGDTIILHQYADESMAYEIRNSNEVHRLVSEETLLKILLQEEEETIIKLFPLSNKLTDLRILRNRIFDKNSIHFNS